MAIATLEPKNIATVSNAAEIVFQARGLSKIYRLCEVEVHALRDVDLDLYEGELVVILGPSGGGKSLQARVRLIEPTAFTKVSALGIEEQRVNVIADFVGDLDSLGDGYRVETRIVAWENSQVIKAPASALFRHGDKWKIFVVEGDKAISRAVEIGHRTALEVEILRGLNTGEIVILHPSNQLSDGALVEAAKSNS